MIYDMISDKPRSNGSRTSCIEMEEEKKNHAVNLDVPTWKGAGCGGGLRMGRKSGLGSCNARSMQPQRNRVRGAKGRLD